jgi:signal peptidase I
VPQPVSGTLRAHLAGLGAVTRFGALLLVSYSLFFNLSVVRGSSMAPGIQDGDRILVEPWSYLLSPVERGDVVVLRYPLDPEIDYIKRVIGLPGDCIALAHGEVWVNGERLAEPYVESIDTSSSLAVVIEPGHYFVLGDNRNNSTDSRFWNHGRGAGLRVSDIEAHAKWRLFGSHRNDRTDFSSVLRPLELDVRLEGIETQSLREGIASCLERRPAVSQESEAHVR